MISKIAQLRIAILRNYETPEKWGQTMLESWFSLIRAHTPDAEIQVFCHITGGVLPKPEEFDAIILTGGVFDLTLPKPEPWVQDVLDLIRDIAENHPNTKIIGACWGHQAIARALGGSIAFNAAGERVGVHPLQCTRRGLEFFSNTQRASESMALSLHQFHKRHVAHSSPGFAHLAEDNEVLLSDNNQILTFQGHPEMTGNIVKGILDGDGGSCTGGISADELAQLKSTLDLPHDGLKVFGRVMDWIAEQVNEN